MLLYFLFLPSFCSISFVVQTSSFFPILSPDSSLYISLRRYEFHSNVLVRDFQFLNINRGIMSFPCFFLHLGSRQLDSMTFNITLRICFHSMYALSVSTFYYNDAILKKDDFRKTLRLTLQLHYFSKEAVFSFTPDAFICFLNFYCVYFLSSFNIINRSSHSFSKGLIID